MLIYANRLRLSCSEADRECFPLMWQKRPSLRRARQNDNEWAFANLTLVEEMFLFEQRGFGDAPRRIETSAGATGYVDNWPMAFLRPSWSVDRRSTSARRAGRYRREGEIFAKRFLDFVKRAVQMMLAAPDIDQVKDRCHRCRALAPHSSPTRSRKCSSAPSSLHWHIPSR